MGEIRKILVTGTPRSGTRFLSSLLSESGLEVPHERMGNDGTVSSLFAVDDDSYCLGSHGTTGERRGAFEFEHVWHLFRDPLETIGSLGTVLKLPAFWKWQEKHTGISPEIEPLSRAMRFWMVWNGIVTEQGPTRKLRVEDSQTSWPDLSAELGVSVPYPTVSPTLGKDRSKRSVSWDDLREVDASLADLCFQKAQEIGYEGGPQ